MTPQDFAYSRIGMALISAQRVEFITGELLIHLAELDASFYRVTGAEFWANSAKALKKRKTLGEIFRYLKLAPRLVISEELDEYVQRRNILVHSFWKEFLSNYSEETTKRVIEFCQEFGKRSEAIESFFKGFLFFLGLRHVKDRYHMDPVFSGWENDFDYFMQDCSLKNETNNKPLMTMNWADIN